MNSPSERDAEVGPTNIAELKSEDFEKLLGQTVKVTADDQSTYLILAECKSMPQFARPDSRVPFSATFKSDKDLALPQGNYSFELHHLGALDLFMVPTAVGIYEVLFN